MAEEGKEEDLEFAWGRKKGVGGKKKEVRFYESFTFDGVEYTLYDSVYLYKEGEPEPYIGRLVKMWEAPDKSKKVKILWYFRPCEILNFLEGCETLDNELFLASGEGLGLSNINPLVIGFSLNILNLTIAHLRMIKLLRVRFYRTWVILCSSDIGKLLSQLLESASSPLFVWLECRG